MRTIINIFIATIVAMNAGAVAIMLDLSDNAVITIAVTVAIAVSAFLGVFDMPEDGNKRAIRKDMHHDDMNNVA